MQCAQQRGPLVSSRVSSGLTRLRRPLSLWRTPGFGEHAGSEQYHLANEAKRMESVNRRILLASVLVLAVTSAALVLAAYFSHPMSRPIWELVLGTFGVAAGTACIRLFLVAHEKGMLANPWPLIFGPLGVVQLFAGLTIILGYLGAPTWTFYSSIGICFGSFVLSLTVRFFRP